MSVTWVPTIIQIVGTALHFFWCHRFVVVGKLGVVGLGYATSVTYFSMLVLVTIFAHRDRHIK